MSCVRALLILLLFLGSRALNEAQAQPSAAVAPPPQVPVPATPAPYQYPTPQPWNVDPAVPGDVPAVSADPSRVLNRGDQVTFAIVEDKDPPVLLRVADTGELEIPGVGLRVRVAGLTVAQAAAAIKNRLEATFYHTATVRLGLQTVNRAASLGRVYVSGAVRQPGPQPVYPEERLTAGGAVLRAGGFAQFADTRRVKVTRRSRSGPQSFTVDLKAVLEKGEIDKDLELQDGDYVNVPQRRINW